MRAKNVGCQRVENGINCLKTTEINMNAIITLSVFVLFSIALIQLCQCNNIVGNDCRYQSTQGFLKIVAVDSSVYFDSTLSQRYQWADLAYLDQNLSDTIIHFYVQINYECVKDNKIEYDSLFACSYELQVSGACSPAFLYLKDTTYNSCFLYGIR